MEHLVKNSSKEVNAQQLENTTKKQKHTVILQENVSLESLSLKIPSQAICVFISFKKLNLNVILFFWSNYEAGSDITLISQPNCEASKQCQARGCPLSK